MLQELITGPSGEDGTYLGRGPEKYFLYEIVANKGNKKKLIEMEAFTSTLGLLTYSVTDLSALCSCIPFVAFPQVPGLLIVDTYLDLLTNIILLIERSIKNFDPITYRLNGLQMQCMLSSFYTFMKTGV